MDALKVQILPDDSSSTLTKPKSKLIKMSILLIVASVSVMLGLLFVSNSNYVLSSGTKSLRYSIIIDAGSSGTRVHVFGYRIQSGKPVFDFGEENYASLKLSPGLSTYDDNPEGASESVAKLVEFAKTRVPKRMLKKSVIRLMATAGMRLLEVPVQEQILEVTRRVLRSSGFKFHDKWASVISGTDEGVYAWVVANHGLGSLGGDPLQTTGIVELGGASVQVTFVSSEPVPPEFSSTISYGKGSYTIYSHSFLDFGQFFGLEEKDWLSEMIPAGKRFCGEEWSKLKEKYPTTTDKYLHRYCFSPAYIISILHNSFGVPLDDERVKFAITVGEENIPLDWALGAFILSTVTPTPNYSGISRKFLGFK